MNHWVLRKRLRALQERFNKAFHKYVGRVMDEKLFKLIAGEAIDIMDDENITTGFNIYTDFVKQPDGTTMKLFREIEIDSLD